jgi:glutamine synthetase adenylyltransferase
MNELYLANRNLSESYRQTLQEKISSLDQSIFFSGETDINPQKYYLDFKDRALELVHHETELLQKECLQSDNCHLILLKQTVLVDTVVQAAFASALRIFNHQHHQDLTQETAPLAILARGGYGREEMYFRSDVDIQIVAQSSLKDEEKKTGRRNHSPF